MKKVWIDVTTTIEWWRGHPTGVQRVVYNYAKRFKDHPDYDAHLVLLDGAAFREISFEEFEATVTRPVVKPQPAGFTDKIKQLPAQIRGNGLALTKRAVRGVPVVGSVAAASYKGARRMYRRMKGVEVSQDADSSIFSADDMVLLMDGNWGDKGRYAAEIVKARKKVGFTLVHVVHDLIAVVNPAYANLKADEIIGGYFKKVLPAVDKLVCISQSTMNDVQAFAAMHKLQLTSDRSLVRVGELADLCPAPKNMVVKKSDFTMPSEFILCVGTMEIRKNYHALYYAYKLAAQKGIELPQLVIVGKKGWMVEETVYMLQKDVDLQGKVQMVWADDETRDKLYQNCLFTVQPSFYEGWGLPVTESLRYGKLPVSANTSSLLEAGGDLAEYFSPFDTGELLEKIAMFTQNPKLLREREALITKNYTPFSWDDSFKQMEANLKQMV